MNRRGITYWIMAGCLGAVAMGCSGTQVVTFSEFSEGDVSAASSDGPAVAGAGEQAGVPPEAEVFEVEVAGKLAEPERPPVELTPELKKALADTLKTAERKLKRGDLAATATRFRNCDE